VLHLRYIEQTERFMFLLKRPIDGPFSASAECRKRSKTVDATHPSKGAGARGWSRRRETDMKKTLVASMTTVTLGKVTVSQDNGSALL
jgi:hypothetical protein